jgi:hypothetical protein
MAERWCGQRTQTFHEAKRVVKKGANECFRLRERPLAIFTALDLLGARSAEVVDGDRLRNAFEK